MTPEEYNNLPVLVTTRLIGTKRSVALDADESHEMTFNSYDIEHAIGNVDYMQHYNATEINAFQMGDALVPYIVGDIDIVDEVIRKLALENVAGSISPLGATAEENMHTTHEILHLVIEHVPSWSNLDPADAFDELFSKIVHMNIVESDKYASDMEPDNPE